MSVYDFIASLRCERRKACGLGKNGCSAKPKNKIIENQISKGSLERIFQENLQETAVSPTISAKLICTPQNCISKGTIVKRSSPKRVSQPCAQWPTIDPELLASSVVIFCRILAICSSYITHCTGYWLVQLWHRPRLATKCAQ